MMNLPLLTDVLHGVKDAGKQFNQLLLGLFRKLGRSYGFRFESGSFYKDAGIDGFVNNNFPGIQPECFPAAFQFKWLDSPINQPPFDKMIQNDFLQAYDSSIMFKSYILVVPKDLTPPETVWLRGFSREFGVETHYIGHKKIVQLLKQCPALKKYFYGDWEQEVEHLSITYKRYVNSQANILKYLEFIGLPTGQYQRQDLLKATELIKVYIPIDLKIEREGTVQIELPDVVRRSKRCVILGDPGSGKSTLAKYLALCYSKQLDHKQALDVEERLPLIINIREYVRALETNTGKVSDFADYLTLMAEKSFNLVALDKDFFIAYLEMGKAIVLFDGLDEVASKKEKIKITQQIKVFSERYPDNHIWVTSRIFGYSEDLKAYTGDFDHYYLAPVSHKQADTFIEQWYDIQIQHHKRERNTRIESLKKAVRENAGVRRLLKNPLLLTMMTLVHQFEGTLPDDRGKLYEKCVELLLRTWQEQKYISQGLENPMEKRGIRLNDQLRLLAAAAMNIQERNQGQEDDMVRGLIEEKELEAVLFESRYDPRRISEDKAREDVSEFIQYLRDRVGLFVERGKIDETGESLFSFIHLSFLEYLCAYQLSEDKSKSRSEHIEQLLDYIKMPTWEEIILLALYIFSKSPGGNVFIDQFCIDAFNMLEKDPIPECWYLLGRAVRDNISFALEDMKKIVAELVKLWIGGENKDISRLVLKEIKDFSDEGKKFLKDILDENVKRGNAQEAYASLLLLEENFKVNAQTFEAILKNQDHSNLFPYLPAFKDTEFLHKFIDNHLDINHWNLYYNSSNDATGKNLDDIINYRIKEQEITGYILSSWSKIIAAIKERKHFLKINQVNEKEPQITKINFDFSHASLESPLCLFHHFLDGIETYLDAIDNLQIQKVMDNQFFYLRDKQILDKMNLRYIFRWVNDIMDANLIELEGNLPSAFSLSPGEFKQLKDINKTFSLNFSDYLCNQLVSYLLKDFSKEFSAFFSKSVSHDFQRCLNRDFSNYLSQDYKRDTGWHISKTFSRFIDHDFSKELSRHFIRYFQVFFNEALCLDFVNTQSQRFSLLFKEAIANEFEKLFKTPLDWENLENTEPSKIHRCFVNRFIEHDMKFIGHFYNHLYNYLIYVKIKISFHQSYIGRDPQQNSADLSEKNYRKIKIREPFLTSFVFDFFLTGDFNHYIIKILAHLNQTFFKNNYVKPTESLLRERTDAYCKNFPFHFYIIRRAWDIYSNEFKKKTEPKNKLNDLRLACLITNAAKITLLTDKHCIGKDWKYLLEMAKESTDPFVKVAYSFYKMAAFEDRVKTTSELNKAIRGLRRKHPNLFDLLGFSE